MSVLQRKAQVGKQEHQARAMSVPKALRIALAKVADQSFGMALAVIGVSRERWSGEEIESRVKDGGLLLLLDGPRSTTGGALLDSPLVTALVQQQTTGRVSKTPAPERRMTETDAALCAPLLDALFTRAHGLLETDDDRGLLPPFKFGARAETPRLFGLALGASEYHVFHLTIDVAAGTAQSTATFILPVAEAKPDLDADDAALSSVPRSATLERSVMGLRTELGAVLCKVRLSLSQLSKLAPGDELSIPADSFESLELVTIEGRRVATASMGQIEGARAVMLNADPDTGKTDTDKDRGKMPARDSADYSNLNLPELEIPPGPKPIEPDFEGNLPDLPDFDDSTEPSGSLPDLPDLPELPDLDTDFPDLDDLPKLNIA